MIHRINRLLRFAATALICCSGPAVAHPPGATVTNAATQFLQTLSAEQRGITTHGFDDPERFAFRWTPGGRSGITLGNLSPSNAGEACRYCCG